MCQNLSLPVFEQSFLEAMQHIQAKGAINAELKTYRYYDNVRIGLVGKGPHTMKSLLMVLSWDHTSGVAVHFGQC